MTYFRTSVVNLYTHTQRHTHSIHVGRNSFLEYSLTAIQITIMDISSRENLTLDFNQVQN